ncbi:kinase A anchor protein [Coniochaeta sp. 2T2.1]|nr:kinase A anchor protein [Coniochaeta sp. 2T2.1]
MPPKPFPTHFLCIPLVTPSSRPQLSQSVLSFAPDVAAETAETASVIPQSAIRPVGTLHLTLGVCSFPKNEGLEAAKDLLRSLKPREILAGVRREAAARTTTTLPGENPPKPPEGEVKEEEETEPPLKITLRGLASMQTPQKTSVLYARPVDDRGVLQTFCEKLRGVFIDAGLMQEENRPLLLHATVLNTIYVKNPPPGESEGGRGNKRKRGRRGEKQAFDARGLIDRYEDHVWMRDCPVGRIELCKMGAKKIDVDGVEDEVYEAVAEVEF